MTDSYATVEPYIPTEKEKIGTKRSPSLGSGGFVVLAPPSNSEDQIDAQKSKIQFLPSITAKVLTTKQGV